MRPAAVDLSRLRPDRVCLIKPSSLGDVVHALPVLSACRELWPRAHLAWVINRGLRGLVDGHPHLDEVIPFDRGSISWKPRGLWAMGRFLGDLRRRRFDLAVDLQGLLRSGVMTAATGARARVGLASAREGSARFYTHRVAVADGRTHAVDRLMAVVAEFGGDPAPRFTVAMTAEDRAWAVGALAGIPRPCLAINLGARWVTKRWPPSRFAEVARRAVIERGAGLVLVGAPEDRPLVREFLDRLTPMTALDLAGKTTLPQLAAIAAEADVFLSNDTGPLHLAAAAGARAVGVFTCTDPAKTGPYGPDSRSVASRIWCAASCVKVCPRMECMDELGADRVWETVRDWLPGDRALSA